jgi:hypothetical protein
LGERVISEAAASPYHIFAVTNMRLLTPFLVDMAVVIAVLEVGRSELRE